MATAAATSVARRTLLLCAIHDNGSHRLSKNDDVSRKSAANIHAFQISHPCQRRLMGTSAQKEGDEDIDVAVQAVNER